MGEPPNGYEYQMKFGNGLTQDFEPVDEDSRAGALLMWVYNYFVHRIPGSSVVSQDEIMFEVSNATVVQSPEWSCNVECFCFLEQTDAVITFKLHRKED